MEVVLKRFFEHFDTLQQNSLLVRYRRRLLVTYFHNLIEDCRLDDLQQVIREVVTKITRYHENSRKQNGNVCLMGKYHDVLYIAVKICYDRKLQDTATIATLLDHIYSCEKTFERILVGSLFGCTAPYFISGWKSDFSTKEENAKAVVYFLDCATNAKLEYSYGKDKRSVRYIDIPIESSSKMSCVMILAMMGDQIQLLMFLRYGALMAGPHDNNGDETIFEVVLGKLTSKSDSFVLAKYDYKIVCILKILLRCTDKIFLKHQSGNLAETVVERYLNLLEKQILPPDRCGFKPAKLKHFCRLTIRKRLWKNYKLPNGINSLPIPEQLQRYVDIMED